MKHVKIQGGLGNQLFGLAFAHSVKRLSGGPVALDVSGFPRDPYGRRFETREIAVAFGPFANSHSVLGHPGPLGAVGRRLAITGVRGVGPAPPDAAALRRLVKAGGYFDGAWQSPAYFAEAEIVRRCVRDFLRARGGTAPRHDVVIHLRTYKEELQPERRTIPAARYFADSLALIDRELGRAATAVLISDDPGSALERLAAIGRPFHLSDNSNVFADAALMLNARSLILSNSSFSWWGGFCSDASVITYPRRGDLYHYPAPAQTFTCL
jgi:hypothetical protein